MADSICRALRDGSLEGEYAPALMIEDSISSPFSFEVFTYVLAQLSTHILAGKSQARGVVVVSLCRTPSFYVDFLKKACHNDASSQKWIRILDCYTDPLGWKDQMLNSSHPGVRPHEGSLDGVCVCKDVKDLNKLYSSITELGKAISGGEKQRFSVAIDSVDEMLRQASTSSVAGLLSNLRSNDCVSSVFWSCHSDLHEGKVVSSLQYMSSIVANLEPLNPSANLRRGNLESRTFLEQTFWKGRLNVRLKRRNGRVRILREEFHVDESKISFTSVARVDGVVNQNQSILPKLQFNLQLSEKERIERADVVLPFEHQGNGKSIEIYDGRTSVAANKTKEVPSLPGKLQQTSNTCEGEIIYYRDSDDEMPDSDEDPDDDLDI